MKAKWMSASSVALVFCFVLATGCKDTAKRDQGVHIKGSDAVSKAVTIDAQKVREPISKYIYGQFIEHLGRCIYGGIWAEMLEDRKFYFPVTADFSPWQTIEPPDNRWSGAGVPYKIIDGSPWQIVGPADNVTMVKENSYVGEHTPCINLVGERNPGGIVQSELGLVENKKYTGRVVIAGGPQSGPVKVSLIWGKDEKDRQSITIDKLSSEFIKIHLAFKAGASTDNGRLEIVGYGKGMFKIGTVSLMPADNINGFRADTIKLMKELNSPVYRWPGGNFVSGYNWRDGIGERDRRPPRKNPAWTGIEHNDVGIHEFMDLCELLRTEPFIAVNTGLGSVQETAQEIQYCNGRIDTPMGKMRAENGHAQSFGVKWWAVGNEMYGDWQLGHMPLEDYVKKHNAVVDAMRTVDVNVKLIAVGDAGQSNDEKSDWSRTMMTYCSDHMDLISEHFYRDSRRNIEEHIDLVRRAIIFKCDAHRKYRATIDGLDAKDIRIAMDEWNYWYGPYVYGELGVRYFHKDALGIAVGLHEYFRNSDICFMANYAQTVNVIGCIKTSKTAASMATTGLVLQLYRREFGEVPVQISGDVRPLDVTAAWTKDRDALTIAIINPARTEYQVMINLKNAELTGRGMKWVIEHDDPMAYNEPGKEPKVVIEANPVSGVSDSLTAGPLSVTVYKLSVR